MLEEHEGFAMRHSNRIKIAMMESIKLSKVHTRTWMRIIILYIATTSSFE